MSSLMACIAGMALDAVFGDPVWLYHPVRIIGKWISRLEKWLRGFCKNEERKERIAGGILWFGVVMVSVGIPWGLLYLAGKVSFWLRFALETFWCYQLFTCFCRFYTLLQSVWPLWGWNKSINAEIPQTNSPSYEQPAIFSHHPALRQVYPLRFP